MLQIFANFATLMLFIDHDCKLFWLEGVSCPLWKTVLNDYDKAAPTLIFPLLKYVFCGFKHYLNVCRQSICIA